VVNIYFISHDNGCRDTLHNYRSEVATLHRDKPSVKLYGLRLEEFQTFLEVVAFPLGEEVEFFGRRVKQLFKLLASQILLQNTIQHITSQ